MNTRDKLANLHPQSLKAKILTLVLLAGLALGALLSTSLYVFWKLRSKAQRDTVITNLAASLSNQTKDLAITFLLQEQTSGRSLLLERIAEAENLEDAAIYSNYLDIPQAWRCEIRDSNYCVTTNKSTLGVLSRLKDESHDFGYFLKTASLGSPDREFRTLYSLIILPSLLVFGSLFFLLARMTARMVPSDVSAISEWLAGSLNREGVTLAVPKTYFSEFRLLGNQMHQLLDSQRRLKAENLSLWKNSTLAEFSAQIVHDIRSPLTALQVAALEIDTLPEATRTIIRCAIGRIQNITKSLLTTYTRSQAASPLPAYEAKCSPLVCAQELLWEKAAQYRQHLSIISFDLDVSPDVIALHIPISADDLKRILSNLIDNAVEALDGRIGHVRVAIESISEKKVLIRVIDNGKGMSSALKEKILNEGGTHGKAEGHGLGLSFVRKMVNDVGGGLTIESDLEKGTKIVLSLPITATPKWFTDELRLGPSQKVFVVDDDPSVLELWKRRLNDLDIATHYFSSPEEPYPDLISPEGNYFVDYEFRQSQFDGIDFILKYKLAKQAVLVTYRYNDETVQARCEKYNIRMLPKPLIPFFKLVLNDTQG